MRCSIRIEHYMLGVCTGFKERVVCLFEIRWSSRLTYDLLG